MPWTHKPSAANAVFQEENGDYTYVERVKIPLDHGTLLIMEGATQADWQVRMAGDMCAYPGGGGELVSKRSYGAKPVSCFYNKQEVVKGHCFQAGWLLGTIYCASATTMGNRTCHDARSIICIAHHDHHQPHTCLLTSVKMAHMF